MPVPLHQQIVSFGGGGGNQLIGVVPIVAAPVAGDFLVLIIIWQCGLPSGGYIPQQPGFRVVDDIGQKWQNLFDVFDGNGPGGPGIGYNSQFSMSVWFCSNAIGRTFNISVQGDAVPNIGDQQGMCSYSDWQLDNRNAVVVTQKVDHTNTAAPTLPAFNLLANQLIIACFWFPVVGTTPPVLAAQGAGYTVMNGYGSNPFSYLDEINVRPSGAQNTPGMTVTLPQTIWLMGGIQIDISQPALQVGQIRMGDLTQLAIEE